MALIEAAYRSAGTGAVVAVADVFQSKKGT
jgi:hypothetical protein